MTTMPTVLLNTEDRSVEILISGYSFVLSIHTMCSNGIVYSFNNHEHFVGIGAESMFHWVYASNTHKVWVEYIHVLKGIYVHLYNRDGVLTIL